MDTVTPFFKTIVVNDDLMTVLFHKLVDIRRMRSSIVTSCRTYQLIMIMTFIYLDKYKINIEDIISEEPHGFHTQKSMMSPHKQKLQTVIKMIDENKSLLLHKLIAQNKRMDDAMMPIVELKPEYFKRVGSITICPLCIYSNSEESVGSILHYFTIINYEGVLYLASSYGSDHVHVRPEIIEIEDPDELNWFFKELPNIKSMEEDQVMNIRTLFIKYFLPNGESRSYDLDTTGEIPSLRFKMISFEQGKDKVWEEIKDNLYSFSIAVITPYIDELVILLETLGQKNRRTKKQSKKRKNKRRLTKKRKNKRRLTKKRNKRLTK